MEPDPPITEGFANGIVLCGDTLRVLGESGLNKREMEELPEGRYFAPEAWANCYGGVTFPAQAHSCGNTRPEITAERGGTSAPGAGRQAKGEVLSILPTLVYGQPPTARVDGERLTYLGSGTVPVRDLLAERQLVRDLQRTLKLLPGRKEHLTGAEAIQMATRLKTWRGRFAARGTRNSGWRQPLVPRLDLRPLGLMFFLSRAMAGQKGRARQNTPIRRQCCAPGRLASRWCH